ncbi:hypothetical protein LIA77_11236 [Sarocladium implicatum]|nr:hypothetical protein LIA77_11236 [Sarocladium implicatum]
MDSQTRDAARPTEWVTPMVMNGDTQTVAYASFVSAKYISSKTREDVFVVTCAPSQCDEEIPKQTLTQQIEMYVCPGDGDYCQDYDEDELPVTRFGYPLGWHGDITVDGTTTEWQVKMSVIKDDERSSGVTKDDTVTYQATTRVGKDVKATTSVEDGIMDNGCLLYDHYAIVSVTAGVKEMLKDYPDDMFPMETPDAKEYVSMIEAQRKVCARQTSGATTLASNTGKTSDGSGPKETGSSDESKDDDDNKDDDDSAAGKTSLSFVLMGALFAFSMFVS